MPKETVVHIRYPDGREQRLIGKHAEKVAAREEERHGAKRYEPEAPYTAEDAAKAARATQRTERATAPATTVAANPAGETKK